MKNCGRSITTVVVCGLLKQLSNVHLRDKKGETKNMRERKFTRVYKLKIDDDNSVNIMNQVCKSFYLSTLGLAPDKMVTTSLSKSGQLDGREGEGGGGGGKYL